MRTEQLFDPFAEGRITRAGLVKICFAFAAGTRQARYKDLLFRIRRLALGRFFTHPLYNAKLPV
jgi:hypothetical protein